MDLLKKSNKIKSIPVDSADRTEIQTLVSRKDGAPNFELRKFKIMPGGNIPEHYHSDIEHEQYVLKGGYTIGVGNKTFNAESGDAIFIPAGDFYLIEVHRLSSVVLELPQGHQAEKCQYQAYSMIPYLVAFC